MHERYVAACGINTKFGHTKIWIITVGSYFVLFYLRARSHLTTTTCKFLSQMWMVPLVILQPILFCRQEWVQHPFLMTTVWNFVVKYERTCSEFALLKNVSAAVRIRCPTLTGTKNTREGQFSDVFTIDRFKRASVPACEHPRKKLSMYEQIFLLTSLSVVSKSLPHGNLNALYFHTKRWICDAASIKTIVFWPAARFDKFSRAMHEFWYPSRCTRGFWFSK